MTVITLTTDFGSSHPAIGRVSGVIWRAAPDAHLVDLTHEIPQGDILAAQVMLENALPYFPDGAIHLVIVDPGMELELRPLVVRAGMHMFVGPDNGLVTPLLERAEANRWAIEIFHASNEQYWLAEAARRIPAEELYAPLAGHLARGIPLAAFGERINDPVRLSIPAPEMIGSGWRGQVLQIDHFGNLATNLRRAHLEGMGPVQVTAGGQVIEGLAKTFGDGKPGDLIALFDSSNRLSICVVNASAAGRLNAHRGDVIEVQPVS